MRRIWRHLSERSRRGQSMVEMSLLLPVLATIVVGTLEFGFMFDHHLTLEYATREGARVGAALADGDDVKCDLNGDGALDTPAWTCVDPLIIAAVQRVLTSPGSPVDVDDVAEIRIYKSGLDGEEGLANIWRPLAGSGPWVDGVQLNFIQFDVNWSANVRNNGAINTDSIGVALDYVYEYQTPFRFLFGGSGQAMTDRTVMQLNPTN